MQKLLCSLLYTSEVMAEKTFPLYTLLFPVVHRFMDRLVSWLKYFLLVLSPEVNSVWKHGKMLPGHAQLCDTDWGGRSACRDRVFRHPQSLSPDCTMYKGCHLPNATGSVKDTIPTLWIAFHFIHFYQVQITLNFVEAFQFTVQQSTGSNLFISNWQHSFPHLYWRGN